MEVSGRKWGAAVTEAAEMMGWSKMGAVDTEAAGMMRWSKMGSG
jgi:hypothetical protein